ncbi:AMP-binding protein [Kutzneria kofuensis]|uniref:Fatty-acyl-CoA synthase n=1 Tax=Kutzneria kofuensis TaxID=103725 RepID=A0A7W9NFF1_9PSEU|nr:AMP-binding protein [Kutzneria kofuensis]MBB5891322.1 fatty-acyl-CoA synthase [Kutzneria kofuensis]
MQGNTNYVAALLDMLAAGPDRPALHWKNQSVSGAELRRRVIVAARVMRGVGIGADDVVGILTTTNSPDTLVARYAANLVGATVTHLRATNAALTLEQLPVDDQLDILRDTPTTMLVVDKANIERARQIRDRMPTPPAMAGFGALGTDFLDLTAHSGPAAIDWTVAEPTGTAMVTYTSGTTGRPKGIGRAFAVLAGIVAHAAASPDPAIMLVITPLSHSVSALADEALAAGGTLVLHESFDAGEVLQAVAEHRVTATYLATPQIYSILDHPAVGSTDLSSLREVGYGGCPASPDRLGQAVDVLGKVLIQTYGTTESAAITVLTPDEHLDTELRGTVGRPLPFVQIEVRDPETHSQLPAGEVGEICVKSMLMMDGYWGDAEQTDRTLRDGWLHTGDLGRVDDRGYVYLVGRMAEVIKTGGIKVHPTEIENALLAHSDVAQAAVFGVTDGDNVEHVYAAVVPRPGVNTSPEQLCTLVSAILTPAHVPAHIELLESMPMTDSGKPDKAKLKSLW